MMEFVMSRLSMCLCAAIVLAAVMIPVSAVCQDMQCCDLQKQAESISGMIDSFTDSDVTAMTVSCRDIIPAGCTVDFDANLVKVDNGERSFSSIVSYNVISDGPYGPDDCIKIIRSDGSVIMERIT